MRNLRARKPQDALDLFDKLPPPWATKMAALRDELRGDAFAALGRKDEARTAYTDALTNLDANAGNHAFLQMKLDDLGRGEKKGS